MTPAEVIYLQHQFHQQHCCSDQPWLAGCPAGPHLTWGVYADACCRKPKYDLDKMDGAWKKATPLLGNVLELLTPNFHRKVRCCGSNRFQGISSSGSSSLASGTAAAA
jgi:hypothetical protein